MPYPKAGDTATLIEPYRGYYNITLIEETDRGWIVEICGSGKVIEVCDDEFELD